MPTENNTTSNSSSNSIATDLPSNITAKSGWGANNALLNSFAAAVTNDRNRSDEEVLVNDQLSLAQSELKRKQYSNALTALKQAREKLTCIPQDRLINKKLNSAERGLQPLGEVINALIEIVDNFKRTKNIYARIVAENIVHHACVEPGRLNNTFTQTDLEFSNIKLFHVHKERLISEITSGLKDNWHKFYNPNKLNADYFDQLDFPEIYQLISKDFKPFGKYQTLAKRLVRGGIVHDGVAGEHRYLEHSHTLGPVIQQMLDKVEFVKLPDINFAYFSDTDTYEYQPEEINVCNIDWEKTLQNWGKDKQLEPSNTENASSNGSTSPRVRFYNS